MPNQPQRRPRPTYSELVGYLTPAQSVEVAKEAVERSGTKFVQAFMGYKKTFGLEAATPKQAWHFYTQIMDATPGLWDWYKRIFPDEYEKDNAHYARLRARALAGDFDDEETFEPRDLQGSDNEQTEMMY